MRFLLAILLCLPVFAHADDWNTTDKLLGGIALGATVLDYGQTKWVAECKNRTGCSEGNPLLGAHPSVSRVNGYFVIVPVAAFFLAAAAAMEVTIVAHNYHVGAHFSF